MYEITHAIQLVQTSILRGAANIFQYLLWQKFAIRFRISRRNAEIYQIKHLLIVRVEAVRLLHDILDELSGVIHAACLEHVCLAHLADYLFALRHLLGPLLVMQIFRFSKQNVARFYVTMNVTQGMHVFYSHDL